MHSDWFAAFWYLPLGQSVQLAAAEVVEYLPAAHSTHELAPAAEPVFVIDPAAQSMHEPTSDAVEYLPAPHAVHVVAPVPVPASVIEPAAHVMQSLAAFEPPVVTPTGL